MILLDGKKLSHELAVTLKQEMGSFAFKPTLIIIQVGDLKESNVYIKKKMDYATEIGAVVIYNKYSENEDVNKIIADIQKFNSDPTIQGIMVQLPILGQIDSSKILESIDPKKDVDGLTATNMKKLFDDNEKQAYLPATTKGIIELLEHYKIPFQGKKVVIISDSILVGRPTTLALLNRDATVTICHSHTKDLKAEVRQGEIIIVAAGSPGLITSDYINEHQIIVDIGITITEQNKAVGDVDFQSVKDKIKAITPVPGGVGPMTVYSLFENLREACSRQSFSKKP